MRAPRIRHQLNLRAILVLTVLGLATAPALFFLWGYQEKRVLRVALEQVKAFQEASLQAKDRNAQGRANDLALRHLNPYLEYRPNDPDALVIEADLLTARNDPGSAAKVFEHILGVEKAGWKAHQNARRRLAAYYIQFSDDYRAGKIGPVEGYNKLMPEEAVKHLKYNIAEIFANQLLEENAKANSPVDDPEVHRLRAMALEGQIIPNNKKSRDGGVDVKNSRGVDVSFVEDSQETGKASRRRKPTLEEAAILEYQNALALDPGDVVAADRLAKLCQKAEKPDDARKVLDDLLKARPDVVKVRTVRYNYFREIGDTRAAADELAAAHELAPENLGIILIGAENALQSDSKDTAEARRWLDKVPTDSHKEPPVLLVRGMIEYSEKHYDKAISIWRTDRANASDLGLTQRLAMVLLELGRDDEAAQFVDQYRRLAADQDPLPGFLEAIQDERASRFRPAIERLRRASERLPEGYQETLHLALGRCYEKLGEWDEAEKSYRTTLQLRPKSVALRLSLARLLLEKRPEEAARELAQGLIVNPNQPELLITLTQAKLQEQKSRRPERRNWTAEFDPVYKQALAAAPQSSELALLYAERLVAEDAKLDRAREFLKVEFEKAPESAALAIRLAEYLQSQGLPDQALQVLAKASDPKAAGDRGWLRIQRALVMTAQGHGREARALLIGKVDELPPAEQNEVWRFLVLLCTNQGDQETTQAAYNDWLRLLPNDPRPKLALLEMEIVAGDPKVIHNRLESLRPPDDQDKLDFTWNLAQARVLLWRISLIDTPAGTSGAKSKEPKSNGEALLKKAEKLVEDVLHDNKIDPAALLLKGQILEKEGAREKAFDAYTQAWNRGNAEALFRLVDLLVDLKRTEDLDRLRQSDTTKQLDQIVAAAHLKKGQKEEALRIVQQSLTEKQGRQGWQVGMLDSLGENEKSESALRALAEQSDRLEVWLKLVRYQADHGRNQAVTDTIAEIKRRLKVEWPELLEAECCWAASDFSAADTAFERARKRYPEVHDVQLVASRYFEDRGRHDAAEACLRSILARNPNDRSVVRQLAVVLTAQAGRPDAWKEALELLGPEGPTTNTPEPEERLTRAIVLARSGDQTRSKQAIDLLQALVADMPAGNILTASARDVLTRLLLATGDAKQASKVAAISAAKGADPSAILLYAEALLQSKQFDSAEEQRKRLETLDPGNVYLVPLRARVIQGRSKPGAVADALKDEYLAMENSAGAEAFGREAFALIVAMGPNAGAVAERLGTHLAERNPALSWMPALFLASRGKRDEALTLCRKSVKSGKNPIDLRSACRIAVETVATHSDTIALKQADEIVDAATRQNATDDDELHVFKALLSHLKGQGHYEEEVEHYRIVLAHQPQNFVALNNIAWSLAVGLDQPKEAMEKIDELIKVAGRNAEYLDTRGVILMRLGRLKDSVQDFEEAVKIDPNGTRRYHLAQAYKKMGRDAEFRQALDEARRAGLTAGTLDPNERAEFEALTNLLSAGEPR